MAADNSGWSAISSAGLAALHEVWIPVGIPGFSGAAKADRRVTLDARFGHDGWRYSHIVRGAAVPAAVAIVEYEASYRLYLRSNPALVDFLTTECGNVYDWDVTNVHDEQYEQPDTAMNHYQDISVRRVIAELVDDSEWPDVSATPSETVDMLDIGTGETHHVPRASGMRGQLLLQIRDPQSPGFVLNPAVVPVHDPTLITSLPSHVGWYHTEGCAHLSVEAFWQMSKVVEVRYDRFLALGPGRDNPLAGV
jgi:hypothetical protein